MWLNKININILFVSWGWNTTSETSGKDQRECSFQIVSHKASVRQILDANPMI